MLTTAITSLFVFAAILSVAVIYDSIAKGIAAVRAAKAELARMEHWEDLAATRLRPANNSRGSIRTGRPAPCRSRLVAA